MLFSRYVFLGALSVWGLTGQGYTRHCVKGEDYPAVIDRNETNSILPSDALVEYPDTVQR